ncbi:hypothetical protein J6590_057332 [Homalodisca vitripennis]|nr:hypothetical protein J6590_057332 [Homalodisca vitripennis]
MKLDFIGGEVRTAKSSLPLNLNDDSELGYVEIEFTVSLALGHATLIIEEFEPDVFRQLIEYIHTGCVTLQPRTLLGKSIVS